MSEKDKKQNTEKPRILVIDDEETITELVKFKLERNNFEVFTACDGIEGLKVLSETDPNLIILDIIMPRMDGFQFFKKLQENKATASIPVLVLTARSAMKEMFEELGANSFLVKPFEPEELLFRVRKIVADTADKASTRKIALVAGSDEAKIKSMSAQLVEHGYKIETAKDGPQALGKALQVMPDLFVVQFDMPNMSADEIVKVLDTHPGAENISVVVFSPLQTQKEIANSTWGHFLGSEQKKKLRKAEAPISYIDKFDTRSFIDKIRNFI